MAKVKNKRNSGLADKVHNKKKSDITKKKLNPFEVHINREKIKVLGKKLKHDRGLPGVARAKAIKKRKETLGVEMKMMNKTNAFIDRRIGEKDNKNTAEDRMIARFAAERIKKYKNSIYNLGDDEILKHRGETLEQIEKFDNPQSSDEEDDHGQKFGGLNDEFVAEGHFGGGILAKSDTKDGAKSHKDLIEQLIAESKKRKVEKQKEKEQTLDLTEKLDTEWKDLQPVVFKRPRIQQEEESLIDKVLCESEKKNEDYDKTMRELKFEKRGTPSDALKSEEKKRKEEIEKIKEFEREREHRMLGEEGDSHRKLTESIAKHRSADDLDDNFVLDDDQEVMLAYDKDGKPLMPEHILKSYSVPNSKAKFEDGISDTSSESEDEESDDEDESDNLSNNSIEVNGKSDVLKKEPENSYNEKVGCIQSNMNSVENDSDESINNSEGSENGRMLKTKSKINNDASQNEEEFNNYLCNGKNNESEVSDSESEASSIKSNVDEFKDLKESDEESADETENDIEDAPVFDLKFAEGDNLNEQMAGKSPKEQSVFLQQLIKKYDPALSEKNKEILSTLFSQSLQYLNDIFSSIDNEGDVMKCFLIFDKLAPHFYDIAHINKVSSKKILAELLKEKHNTFRKHPKKVPDMDTLILFKLVSLLYPTSDFRHPVTTPSLIFMSEILSLSKFKDAYSISRGLFITSLVLEYIVLSKRFIPSAMNFIRGVLYLSTKKSILNSVQVVPPFQLRQDSKVLNLESDCSKIDVGYKMVARDLIVRDIDNDFKIRSLVTCVLMLKDFFNNYNDIDAQECIFEPHLKLLALINTNLYPDNISNMISKSVKYMKESLEMKTYTRLCREKKKPKALRMYEPDVQEVFTGNKCSKLSREAVERKRLKHKTKREMKGALREIRRDKAYIASVKIHEKLQSDNMRKEKVKQIYKEAAIQQGELNKLKRGR